jgi:hypothetical protein
MSQEVERRWKASLLVGAVSILLWIIIAVGVTIIVLIQLIQESDTALVLNNLPSLFTMAAYVFFPLLCLGTPIIFTIVTLGSYYQFRITDDYLIDKYWKNPGIKYS